MRTAASLFCLVVAVSCGSTAEDAAPGKTASFCCPVQGFPASREKGCCCPGGYSSKKPSAKIVLPVAGQPVQFCCTLCTDLFKKTPAKFLAHAHHQLAARQLAVQRACPCAAASPTPPTRWMSSACR